MKQMSGRVDWVTVEEQRVRVRIVPAAAHSQTQTPRLPLLLLHGLGCSSDAWIPSLNRFAALHLPQPIIAPDLPGCGRSGCVGGARSMDAFADWATYLLDTLEISRVSVVGNSMGCQIALAMARRHPARVEALALLGPTLGGANVPFWRYAAGLLLDGFGESFRYDRLLLRMYLQMGLPRYIGTVRRMMEDDPIAHAAEVQVPVLALRGGHDRIVSERMARELADALPQGQYQPLDSTAHAAEFNTPELFTSAVLEFLARVEQPCQETFSGSARKSGRD